MTDKIREFRKRFKNPKNTGYRVGQEFLGAVEIFIETTIQETRQELLTEIEGKLPKEKSETVSQVEKEYFKEVGFNSCLKQIRSIINSIK